jgi:hypothetical protein
MYTPIISHNYDENQYVSAAIVGTRHEKKGKHDNLADYFTSLIIMAGWRIAYSVKGTPPRGIPDHWQSNSKTVAVHTGKRFAIRLPVCILHTNKPANRKV